MVVTWCGLVTSQPFCLPSTAPLPSSELDRLSSPRQFWPNHHRKRFATLVSVCTSTTHVLSPTISNLSIHPPSLRISTRTYLPSENYLIDLQLQHLFQYPLSNPPSRQLQHHSKRTTWTLFHHHGSPTLSHHRTHRIAWPRRRVQILSIQSLSADWLRTTGAGNVLPDSTP